MLPILIDVICVIKWHTNFDNQGILLIRRRDGRWIFPLSSAIEIIQTSIYI